MEFHPQPRRHAAGVLGVPGGQAVHLRVPVKTEHRAAADVAMLLQKRGGGALSTPPDMAISTRLEFFFT